MEKSGGIITIGIRASDPRTVAEEIQFEDLQKAHKRFYQILHTESMKRKESESKLQAQIMGMAEKMQEQLGVINGKFDSLTSTLVSIQRRLQKISNGNTSLEEDLSLEELAKGRVNEGRAILEEDLSLGEPAQGWVNEGGQIKSHGSPKNKLQIEQTSMTLTQPLPKLNFPKFHGTQPRSWVLKCEGYFKLNLNILDNQRATLALMHFGGRAARWYHNFSMRQTQLFWAQFVDVILAGFEELDVTRSIAGFSKLRHIENYSEYVERSERLWACLLLFNSGGYLERYMVASFTRGLSEELQVFFQMLGPTTFNYTIELRIIQLQTLYALTTELKGTYQSSIGLDHTFKKIDLGIGLKSQPAQKRPAFKLIIAFEMTAMKEQGRCYNCIESYNSGHGCKGVWCMIYTEKWDNSFLHILIVIQDFLVEYKLDMDRGQSIHGAVLGKEGITTMRRPLGGLEKQKTIGFEWIMQHQQLTYSPRASFIDECELSWDGDWMKSGNPVELNYGNVTLTVALFGRRKKKQALIEELQCQLIFGHAYYQILLWDYPSLLVVMYGVKLKDNPPDRNPKLEKLLLKFQHILEEPKVLLSNKETQHQGDNLILQIMVGCTILRIQMLLQKTHPTSYGGCSEIHGKFSHGLELLESSRVHLAILIALLKNTTILAAESIKNLSVVMLGKQVSEQRGELVHEILIYWANSNSWLAIGKDEKFFGHRYYEPYTVPKGVGNVAYHFQLCTGFKIHRVFHDSQLEKIILAAATLSSFLLDDEKFRAYPSVVLAKREVVRKGEQLLEFLVAWVGSNSVATT